MSARPRRSVRGVEARAELTGPRDALFDAAERLVRRTPWSTISMATLATTAGVSRQTLYNEFGSREAFAQAWVLRQTEQFVTRFEEAVGRHRAIEAAIAAAFLVFLREAGRNPTVRQIVTRDPGATELLELFTTRGGPVLRLATDRLSARLRQQWPMISAGKARAGAELVVRLAISHASLPGGSVRGAARTVGALVSGYLEDTRRL